MGISNKKNERKAAFRVPRVKKLVLFASLIQSSVAFINPPGARLQSSWTQVRNPVSNVILSERSVPSSSARPVRPAAPPVRPESRVKVPSKELKPLPSQVKAPKEKARDAPAEVKNRVQGLQTEAQTRVTNLRRRLHSTASSIRTDVIKPAVRLAENPIVIQYAASMAARLAYFMSQQAIISSTVDGKRTVDVLALGRAIAAAIGNGREEEVLAVFRISDESITSKAAYAWWESNLKGILDVLKKEAEALETGVYKYPYDMNIANRSSLANLSPLRLLRSLVAYRRAIKDKSKATTASDAPSFVAPGRYPQYYLAQESGDFLGRQGKGTGQDYEQESLLLGMGDAMRRRALAKVDAIMADRNPETASLLDVGCGSGHFLTFVKDNYKLLKVAALDLNVFNLKQARIALEGAKGLTFIEASAEAMPVTTESQDAITAMFLLSSMPSDAQGKVIKEMARCLKPGGSIIIVDYTQPEYDGPLACTLDQLPGAKIRNGGAAPPGAPPSSTYTAYQALDIEYALIKAGLFVQEKEINWVSKVIVARKSPIGRGVGSVAARIQSGVRTQMGKQEDDGFYSVGGF